MTRQDICGSRRGIALLLLCLFALLSTVFLARATATAKRSPLARGDRHLAGPAAQGNNIFSQAPSDPATVYLPLVTRGYEGTIPAVEIDKKANGSDGPISVTAGDMVSYSWTVTNTGNMTLTGVSVTDNVHSALNKVCPDLLPGASCSNSASVTLSTVATVIDTSTVNSTESVTDNDSVTVYVEEAAPPPFGINMYGSIDDAAGLQEMTHLTWVATSVFWSDIEPNPPTDGTPTYDWSFYDAKLGNAVDAGLAPLALVRGNPPWAAEYPGGPVYDMNNLTRFLHDLVERYDGDGADDAPGSVLVQHWMLYPEPDNGSEAYAQLGKGYWGHNAAGLAQLLAEVQPVMKAADPGAKVMIGGLAYDWFEDQGGPFVRSFLPDVLEAGGGEYLDMVAIHYYPLSFGTISTKMQDVKSILNSHGYGDLPMICPEMGYWSERESSEEEQARRLVRMFVRGMSLDLSIMTWFAVFDDGVDTEAHGLLNPDHTPKPAYTAYTVLVSELTSARYSRTLDTEYPEVEGYVFSTERGTREKDVLWVEGGEVTRDLSFPVSALRVVQKGGEESIIYDGGAGDLDGIADGKVTIEITGSPVYVEEYP